MAEKKKFVSLGIKLSEELDEVLKKPKKVSFESLVIGHTFIIEDVGEVKGFPKKAFWCAFCGGRGKKYIVLKREDGVRVKVGHSCVEKAGYNKDDIKKFLFDKANPNDAEVEFVKEHKKILEEPEGDALDAEIQKILNQL